MNIGNITNINNIIINRKIVHVSTYPCYFSLTVKSFAFFALNGYIFVELKTKICCFHYDVGLNNFFNDLVKLQISFFLWLVCTDELLSTPKIATFSSQSKFGSQKKWTRPKPSTIFTIGIFICISIFHWEESVQKVNFRI